MCGVYTTNGQACSGGHLEEQIYRGKWELRESDKPRDSGIDVWLSSVSKQIGGVNDGENDDAVSGSSISIPLLSAVLLDRSA